ncbi:MAG TPA: ABC-three component system middle component 2 [Oculatellaceae cyanobacterium]
MTETTTKMFRPFNLPVEFGIRSLYIFAAVAPQRLDVHRLSYLDYLLIHSADVVDGPPSLHAPVPNRGGEWLVKRQILESGINLMIERELLSKYFDETGISYSSTNLTLPFIDLLKSVYATELKKRATWLRDNFSSMPLSELEHFMVSNLRKWGAEFKRESLFRGPSDG